MSAPSEQSQGLFQKWFAGSNVVDATGAPRVLYHGSGGQQFSEFSHHPPYRNFDNRVSRQGFFFVAEQEVAMAYAWDTRRARPGRLVAAYLDIKNPLRIDGTRFGAALDDYERLGAEIESGRLAGHDGVIITGWVDGSRAQEQFIAFEPGQICEVGTHPHYHDRLTDMTATVTNAVDPAARNAIYSPPLHAVRTALRVDEHGKQIVWERGDYSIAVDSLQDASFITLWCQAKRVGAMSLGAGRSYDTNGYATVCSVEIHAKHRGKGLGKALYEVALTFASDRYLGIGGENEQRSNNRQVPAIYRSLGGTMLPSGDCVITRAEALTAVRAVSARNAVAKLTSAPKVLHP